MTVDEYGQVYLATSEIINKIYSDPLFDSTSAFIDDHLELRKHSQFHKHFEIKSQPEATKPDMDPIDYHKLLSEDWHMPADYKSLDIQNYCYERLQKLNLSDEIYIKTLEEELAEFKKRNMTNVLKFMIYLMQVIKEKDIVTGAGRGSSVSSLVLFLIGVHYIDPIKYSLSYKEFLR